MRDDELEINKNHLIKKHRLALLGSYRYMRLLIAAEINNSYKDFNLFEEKIFDVTSEDVLRVARRYCSPNKGMWVILFPQS